MHLVNDREGTDVRLAACSFEGWRLRDALHVARSLATRALNSVISYETTRRSWSYVVAAALMLAIG
jgi:outer membrane lipopolysaccharide assembly protein LptE/RlpB